MSGPGLGEPIAAWCLIVCITTDDEGRGYYCEGCPELTEARP